MPVGRLKFNAGSAAAEAAVNRGIRAPKLGDEVQEASAEMGVRLGTYL